MTEQSANASATSPLGRPVRILVAKPGLDGHDRGAKVMARAFRDAGFEVIYTGLFQTPEMIANAALQEDVDVVGLSILSGAHMALFPPIVDALKAVGRDDVLLIAGGTIPHDDIARVREMGVSAVFGPGTRLQDAIQFVREHTGVADPADPA
jgi:methylmalonyl-CoA mutase C-terminal domain/subunit